VSNLDPSVLRWRVCEKIESDLVSQIDFFMEDGKHYRMYHEQDCCESVEIEDIEGELEHLERAWILQAEVVTNEGETAEGDSATYTFYKFATTRGYVTIRWCGVSNGYYSETVDFIEVKPDDPERRNREDKVVRICESESKRFNR
jgi:hypothetical protein